MVGQTGSHYRIQERRGDGRACLVRKHGDAKPDGFVALKFLPHDRVQERQSAERFHPGARVFNRSDNSQIYKIVTALIGGIARHE